MLGRWVSNNWVVLVTSGGKNSDIVNQCGQGTDSGYHISIGSGLEGVLSLGIGLVIRDSGATEPGQSTFAGVDFNGEGDKAEESGGGKQDDADQHQGWPTFNQQDAGQ